RKLTLGEESFIPGAERGRQRDLPAHKPFGPEVEPWEESRSSLAPNEGASGTNQRASRSARKLNLGRRVVHPWRRTRAPVGLTSPPQQRLELHRCCTLR